MAIFTVSAGHRMDVRKVHLGVIQASSGWSACNDEEREIEKERERVREEEKTTD